MNERQTQALARIEQDEQVQLMLSHEPALQHIMRIAAAQTNGGERWFAYTALKTICDELVGWGAYHPDLRTSVYWERMMQILDELLPDVSEGVEEELINDYEIALEQAYYDAIREGMTV